MKKFVEMKIGEDVEFYALVESLQKRYTPNKSAYYSISLSDGATTIDARVWDVNLIEKNEVLAGTVFYFIAHINEYVGKPQFVITGVKKVDESEIDVKRFYRTAPLPEENLRNGIKNYIRKINNEVLRNLVVALIAKVPDDYFVYPAAMTMHHNYFNGLAYHIYSMLRLADGLLEVYPGMNSDLLYAGILLHDIGKTKELTGPKSPQYTQEGNLLGHIVIGLQMVAVEANKQQVEHTEEYQALCHLIASHHGELEFGSPKEPTIMEAFALHYIDLIDSKMAPISAEVLKVEKGSATAPVTSLGRKSIYVPHIEK
ncbi:MAG: HD domain-containing protein [Anaeroplasma bactoclasticum]|nr:HD domain-containing protein [Anaeroplasma bactoclasticum]